MKLVLQILGLVTLAVLCNGHRHYRGCDRGHASLVCDDDDDCGERANCTGGPLTLQVQGEDLQVNFCERKFKPKKEQICRVTDADGNDVTDADVTACPDGVECNVGPFPGKKPRGRRQRGRVNLYVCENQDTDVDYAEILKEKACQIDDGEAKSCGRRGSCDGLAITVDGVVLTFCQKDDDDDDTDDDADEEEESIEEELFDVLNGCHRQRRGGRGPGRRGGPPRGGRSGGGRGGAGGGRGGQGRGSRG